MLVHFQSTTYPNQMNNRYMRTECMEHEYIYGRKMPIEMLVRQVSDSVSFTMESSLEEHFCTLTYERRPYGVGFLVAGVDVRSVVKNEA